MFNSWITSHLGLIQFVPYFLSVGVIFFFVIGWRYGKFVIRNAKGPIISHSIVSAIFGLSALVLGFTFSNAANHFGDRISNIRSQAASLEQVYVSTAYLNAHDRAEVQSLLRELLKLRLQEFQSARTMEDLDTNFQLVNTQLQKVNEHITLAILRAPSNTKELADKILRPQIANLVDAINVGILNAKNHPPSIVQQFLFALLCVGALLSGYAMAIEKEEDWLLTGIYLALTGYALFIIFSLEFPNQLFNYDAVNSDLLRLQSVMQ
jgi:hypothetical protein